MNTTVNFDKYFTNDDLAVSSEVAFARWINPQKKNPVGIGIDLPEAIKANFKPSPDDGWELKKATFGKGQSAETIETYVSQNPRLLILNAVNTIAKNVKGSARPFFDYTKFKNGVETPSKYSPILFLVVSADNKIISSPIVLRPKKGCIVQFSKNNITDWTKAVVNFYERLGKQFGSEKPTCSFYARHIFEPTFEISELSNKDGDSSSAWLCNGFNAVDFKHIFTIDSEEAKTINEYVTNLPELLKTVKNKKEEEVTEEAKPEFNVDDYTDPETGEVNLPDHLDNIPF
jgi:hypothetical protein